MPTNRETPSADPAPGAATAGEGGPGRDRPTGGLSPPTPTRRPDPTNEALYRAGRRLLTARARLAAGTKAKPTRAAVAAACGTTPDAVTAALGFADAVDRIGASCGGGAKALLLAGHPRLPARVVMRIGRTHPDRQRYALLAAGAGRNPLGKPPAGAEPPFDTHGYPEVRSRLARTAGLLDRVADGLLATCPRDWPSADRMDRLLRDAQFILAGCREMTGLMRAAGGSLRDDRVPPPLTSRPAARPFRPAAAGGAVASVRGITAKNVRNLPRVVRDRPPTRAEADAVLDRVRPLRRAAERLLAVARGPGPRPPDRAGPGARDVRGLGSASRTRPPASGSGAWGRSTSRPGTTPTWAARSGPAGSGGGPRGTSPGRAPTGGGTSTT